MFRRRISSKIDVNDYLTIEALEDGLTAKLSTNACEYCIDGNGSWVTLSAGTATPSINKGHTLSFRGNLTPTSSAGIGTFTVVKNFNLTGNCLSMLFGDNGKTTTSISAKSYAFYKLFSGCTTLQSVSANFLPATTLSTYCYRYMFDGCTSLTKAPKLPATTVTSYCYQYMFRSCSKLTSAPALPATTLSTYCYAYMFRDCIALTSAPALPTTSISSSATYCYAYMFYGCTSLKTPPLLPATTLSSYCYSYMFTGCTSLIIAPTLPATTLATYCYQYMFQNCTKITSAPDLPATTLTTYCYRYMFYGCSSLTSAPELPAKTLTTSCYQYMFYNCSKLNYIKMLATNISATSCLATWVSGVASSGTFVKDPNMSSIPVNSVSGIPTGWTTTNSSFSTNNYLTIEGLASGTIMFSKACSYSSNGGAWTSLSAGSKISINAGQKISFKANLTPTSTDGIGKFTVSSKFNLMGNCMSMIYGDNVSTSLSGKNYAFYKLFSGCSTLQSVSANFLPATTLATNCYRQMFYGCSSLTNAPTLPAKILAEGCYRDMFNGCSSLTSVPELPATTLAAYCYCNMFDDCSSLTTVPTLPATTLAAYCYSSMFESCSSLTTVPTLPATTLAEGCYYRMFMYASSITTAPALPAKVMAEGDVGCYDSMFYGCTSLTTAPALSAKTLAFECYMNMFRDCTSLTTVPTVLPATILAPYCYNAMFYGCTSLKTPPALPATTLAEGCYCEMFASCYSLTSAPELPATTLAESCYVSMFSYCTSITTAPTLPAKTLVYSCYRTMFCGCSNLNYIKMLATNIGTSGSNCLTNWVAKSDTNSSIGVSSSGTFVQDRYATWTTTGSSGIPTGWTVKSVLNTEDYLTIEILDDYTQITPIHQSNASKLYYFVNGDVERSEHNVSKKSLISGSNVLVNDSGWKSLKDTYSTNNSPTEMFNKGDKISFKDDRPNPSAGQYCRFKVDGYFLDVNGRTESWGDKQFNLTGNCMSMCYGDFADTNNSLSGKPTVFYNLFFNCTGLKSISKNFLPATTLAESCYHYMFYGCPLLINTPDLPATTLAPWCYSYMFGFCSSLQSTPDILPATTLAKCCYSSMFEGCSSLTTAPDLPATTLVESCYSDMFYECKQLNYIKMLGTNATTSHLNDWVYDVATSGTFIKHKNATLTTGQSGIPTGWTVRSDINKPSIYKVGNSVSSLSFSYTGGFYSPSTESTVLSLTTSQLLSLTPDNNIIVDVYYKSLNNNVEKVYIAYTWYTTFKLKNVLEYIYGTSIDKEKEDVVKSVAIAIKAISNTGSDSYDYYGSGGGSLVTPMPMND